MKYSKLEQTAIDIATPIAAEIECYIYDVEYTKEAGTRFLRVFADKTDGKISLDQCEVISRKLSDLLDETAMIDENYYLEVSSPGAARRLKTEAHFEMYLGEKVEVSLYKAIDGGKNLTGVLKTYDNGEVTLDIDGGSVVLQKEKYGKINLYFDIYEVLNKQSD